MPTVEKVARTDSGLASELRISVMRLRRRLVAERHPDNELSLSHMAVLQVRADPAQLFLASRLSPTNLPRSIGDRAPVVYLGSANSRDFVYDRRQGQTLQVPAGLLVLVTRPGPHCHWWEKR